MPKMCVGMTRHKTNFAEGSACFQAPDSAPAVGLGHHLYLTLKLTLFPSWALCIRSPCLVNFSLIMLSLAFSSPRPVIISSLPSAATHTGSNSRSVPCCFYPTFASMRPYFLRSAISLLSLSCVAAFHLSVFEKLNSRP